MTKTWRYSLPSNGTHHWAEIVLVSTGMFAAVSDWGDYAHAWRHPGVDDFREFFLECEREWEYFARKLNPRMEYDEEKTAKTVKQYILDLRRGRHITAEMARNEWDDLRNHEFHWEGGFLEWRDETLLPDAWEINPSTSLSHDVVQFCREILPRLAEEIKRELAAEGPLGMSLNLLEKGEHNDWTPEETFRRLVSVLGERDGTLVFKGVVRIDGANGLVPTEPNTWYATTITPATRTASVFSHGEVGVPYEAAVEAVIPRLKGELKRILRVAEAAKFNTVIEEETEREMQRLLRSVGQ